MTYPLFSYDLDKALAGLGTTCIVPRACTARTLTPFGQKVGKETSWQVSVGGSCCFMAGLEFVLEVSSFTAIIFWIKLLLRDLAEVLELMEASCAIARILQTFSNIRLPPAHPVEPPVQGRQNLTIVVFSADGCKVNLK